jgi:hypothetical protein
VKTVPDVVVDVTVFDDNVVTDLKAEAITVVVTRFNVAENESIAIRTAKRRQRIRKPCY